MARHHDIAGLFKALCAGDRGSLSRCITLVESARPEDRHAARDLLLQVESALQARPPAVRLGITGSPGAGKSTFIETYGQTCIDAGKSVAVLAIDPSSSRTRGSILGDKTRMQVLSRHPQAFVRPSPAGRTLGGVTRSTREALLLCELAGFDHIIIETVGVGQSEHTVRLLCDCMVLLVLPGSGDDLQGIKRGIVELADLVVVNKADGDRIPLAKQTRSDYALALHMRPAAQDNWSPRALTVSSLSAEGLAPFAEALSAFREAMDTSGIQQRRQQQHVDLFAALWQTAAVEELRAAPAFSASLRENQHALASGAVTLSEALAQQLASLKSSRS